MKIAADLIYRNYCVPWIANKAHQTLPPPQKNKSNFYFTAKNKK